MPPPKSCGTAHYFKAGWRLFAASLGSAGGLHSPYGRQSRRDIGGFLRIRQRWAGYSSGGRAGGLYATVDLHRGREKAPATVARVLRESDRERASACVCPQGV